VLFSTQNYAAKVPVYSLIISNCFLLAFVLEWRNG